MPAVIAVCVILLLAIAWLVGLGMGLSDSVKKNLKTAGLTLADLKLYRQAAKILNRLINVTDLEGDFAPDTLSPATRQQIENWITKYQKELDRT